jgi:hypothetical protein
MPMISRWIFLGLKVFGSYVDMNSTKNIYIPHTIHVPYFFEKSVESPSGIIKGDTNPTFILTFNLHGCHKLNVWPLVKLAHEPSSIAYDGGPKHKFKQKPPCAFKGEEHVSLLPLSQLQG